MKMPILALLRHAKSSWDDPAISDFDRPLNDRGKRAAPEMGRVMRDLKISPDIILCSPATRTHQTLDLVFPHLKCSEPDVRYEKALYHANAAALLDQVRRLDDKKRTALFVGHNPGLHGLALTLAGEGATDDPPGDGGQFLMIHAHSSTTGENPPRPKRIPLSPSADRLTSHQSVMGARA